MSILLLFLAFLSYLSQSSFDVEHRVIESDVDDDVVVGLRYKMEHVPLPPSTMTTYLLLTLAKFTNVSGSKGSRQGILSGKPPRTWRQDQVRLQQTVSIYYDCDSGEGQVTCSVSISFDSWMTHHPQQLAQWTPLPLLHQPLKYYLHKYKLCLCPLNLPCKRESNALNKNI